MRRMAPILINGGRRFGSRDINTHRVRTQSLNHLGHLPRERGRKQQILPGRWQEIQKGVNLVREAHVEHSVSLIEYQYAEPMYVQCAYLQVLEYATRRAHDDMRTMLHRTNLRPNGYPTAKGYDLGVGNVFCQRPKTIGNLICQFPCWAQH